MAYAEDAEHVDVPWIDAEFFLRERNRLPVSVSGLVTLSWSPVISVPQIPPQQRVPWCQLYCLFMGVNCLLVLPLVEKGVS